jgi:ribosomal protein S18 acetylase RimI-like enzyme
VTGADDDLVARTDVTTIRFATRDDERRLAAVDRATWSPAVAPAPLWDADVDFFAEDPPEDVLVAEIDGDVVGHGELRRPTDLPSNRHVRQVNGLAVDPAGQRRGVEGVRRGEFLLDGEYVDDVLMAVSLVASAVR